jgi:hypothetical protein
VLFTTLSSDTTYLIDQEGRAVHTWKSAGKGGSLYLLDDGHLLRSSGLADPPNFKAGGVAGLLEKKSWDGDVVWNWELASAERILHHDFEPLPNGNILAIGWELKTPEEARRAGRRADGTPEQGLWSEWLLEIQPIPPNDARIVWEWHVWDHLVQDHDPDAMNHGDPAASPGRLDINADRERNVIDDEELAQLKALGYVPADATPQDIQSDFLHLNSIDYNPALEQIALSIPSLGELWILDRSTTTEEARGASGGRSGRGGEILYRWGNPRSYGRGTKADQQLFYQHQVEWVPGGYPGAGNLTVYNNGQERLAGDWSSIVEITPPLQRDGSYALLPEGRYGPEQLTWEYTASDPGTFFAPFISGTHRLASGNTFVCSGPQGRFFEVDPSGKVVWEYRNPYQGNAPGWMPEMARQFKYGVFRATKLALDHPALRGRDLRPLDPQPAFLPEGLASPSAGGQP